MIDALIGPLPEEWEISSLRYPERTPGSTFVSRIVRRVKYGKTIVGREYLEERNGLILRLAELETWWTAIDCVTRSGRPIWRRAFPVRFYHRKIP